MNMSKMDQALKKKLQTFLNDMLKFGTVKGFKYFSMYLRGREEMMINILNEPHNLGSRSSEPTSPCILPSDVNPSSSFTSHNLPYDTQSLLMSQRSQMALSGYGSQGVGLPPASPSEEEPSKDLNSTVFLIAGYAKYSCPYVWVRSNHERLVRLTGEEGGERDSPLKLKCSAKWKDTDVKIWDVISELIKLCTYPVPRNPFEVDVEYIDCLPLKERVLVTGSLANSLQKIMLHTKDEKHYSGKVFDDLHLVTRKHFEGLQNLVRQKQIPGVENFLQEERKQQQNLQREAQVHARATQRKRYPSQTYTEQAAAAYGLQSTYGGPEVSTGRPADPFSQQNQYGRQGHVGFGYGQTPSMF
ncbi:uncharacterized protein LOC135479220 [Liolophura sinensis]|uniref:uncharacterized protein LOC135479220 n=1 Tax=Liolophura sinensis TaxID=3198878 RepID=UPI0031589DAA